MDKELKKKIDDIETNMEENQEMTILSEEDLEEDKDIFDEINDRFLNSSAEKPVQEEETATKQEKKNTGKKIKVSGMGVLCLVLLFTCTLLLGCALYYRDKAQEEEMPVIAQPMEVTYTKEELEKAKEEAAKEALAHLPLPAETEGNEENEIALETIRNSLEEGKTLLETLRPLYPDHVIVYSSGRYQFFPILEELKKSEFSLENVIALENGEKQYTKDGVIISHKGIDVSKHQGKIDWQKVAGAGVEFAMVRIGVRGYGSGKIVEDERYEENLKGAITNKIKVGAYFFSQAVTVEEAVEEADFVIEKILPYKVDGPIVLDVEKVEAKEARMNALSREERTDVVLAFLKRVEEKGYKGMLYYNTEAGIAMMETERLEPYEKWFAYYGEEPFYPYDYSIWQYSDKGKIPGISEKVDLNIAFRLWE